jgi:hypothetical protein
MRKTVIGLLVAAWVTFAPEPADAWGLDVHRFIVARAIDILPPPLRPFFEANRAFVVERAIDPDLWRTAGFSQEPPNHFLDFDAYGPYPFKDLPREYDEALKKYGPDTLNRNGLVPWRTHEMAGRLFRAFESQQKNAPFAYNDIKFFSAVIGHYVADAHVPLHAVLNYNGQRTGQTGIHYRWEDELFMRFQKRITIKPGPLRQVKHERDFIFETLLESSQLADDVLAADREAIGSRDVYDDQYFETLFVKTRPILEKRLNDSITAVASMITSIWERAGRPMLPATPPPRPPQRRVVARPGPPVDP